MLQCGRRRLHHGVAIGFLPTAPKWAILNLTTKKSGAAAVNTADSRPGYVALVQLRLHSRPTVRPCRLLRIRSHSS
ncbi:MAG: hypothetical protein ACO2PM_11390 [Pyrobaculum sp.]